MHSDEVNQKIMIAELKEAKGSIGLEESISENRNRMIGTPYCLSGLNSKLIEFYQANGF